MSNKKTIITVDLSKKKNTKKLQQEKEKIEIINKLSDSDLILKLYKDKILFTTNNIPSHIVRLLALSVYT
jgi:hypothetical protein